MNNEDLGHNHQKSGKRAVFPWLVIVGTVVVLFVMNFFDFYLNENFNVNPGVKNILNLILPVLMILIVSLWFLLRRRFRPDVGTLLGIIAFASPFLFYLFLQPVVGGDAELLGFESRFWKAEKVLSDIKSADTTVDLVASDPNSFPQFLGPNRNATLNSIRLANWSQAKPQELWRHPIGEGWSAFAAVNGVAVTQEQRKDQECVVCYEIETGNTVWIHSQPRRHEDTMAMGKVGPRATPTIDNGKVYASGATGVLECLDGKTGELIWSADIPALVGIEQVVKTNSSGFEYTEEASKLAWGRSCSPLIVGDLVVMTAGGPLTDIADVETGMLSGPKSATLIAFNKETGEEVWRGGKRMVAYGSPSLAILAEREQIVLTAESWAVGHDPKTGEELWAVQQAGSSNTDANCSQVTPFGHNRFLLSKGYNKGAATFELSYAEDKFTVNPLDTDPRVLKTKFTNPVVLDNHFYSLSDGYLECTQIEGLKRKWKRRQRFGNGQLLLVSEKLLVHSDSGQLSLIEANPEEFVELGTVKTIQGICWNTLCLYGDKLLVRSDKEVACFQLPIESDSQQ
jgi:outer membrane protein assembly factor BamB